MTDGVEPRACEWQFYETPAGGKPVEKELKKQKFQVHEIAHLNEVMDRVAESKNFRREVRGLGDGVFEIKVDFDRRSYRLAFAPLDEGYVLLALHLFRKTKQRDRPAVDLAKSRLQEWRRSTEAPNIG